MSKKYRLKKDISDLFRTCKKGTESFSNPPFYCFPYEGKSKNDLDYCFMVSNPEEMPEWFEEVADPVPHTDFDMPGVIPKYILDEVVASVDTVCSLLKKVQEKRKANSVASHSLTTDTSKEFVWTDALVLEYATISHLPGRELTIEQFKASKQ